MAEVMPELRRLTVDDEAAVLAFELENRDYFARSVSDRGDEFFEHFADFHAGQVARQEEGVCVFHILIDADGSVLGRVNLYDLEDGRAELGYRFAERVTGRGVATAAVENVALLARDEYGLRVLSAKVSDTNLASQRVLEKTGFVLAGAAEINGTPSPRFELDLGACRSSA